MPKDSSSDKTVVLYDLEWTTWENASARHWSGKGEYREIVQIGAVRVDRVTFEEVSAFSALVKPVLNPTLSDYFMELTGITQADVDLHGQPFPRVLEAFVTWVGDSLLFAWGGDSEVLFENARLNRLSGFPFSPNVFRVLKDHFWAHGIDAQQYMSSTLPSAFGLPTADVHTGLGDARALAASLRALGKLIDY